MNLPNRLTLSRIALIGVMIVGILVLACIPNLHVEPIGNSVVNPVYLAIAVIFVIAAVTDLLDGKIARKYNLVSDFGKFLDPIADKLLNDGAMIFLLVPQACLS